MQRHEASTLSRRMNSVLSPAMTSSSRRSYASGDVPPNSRAYSKSISTGRISNRDPGALDEMPSAKPSSGCMRIVSTFGRGGRAAGSAVEQDRRNTLEVDGDFAGPAGKALARAQEERHAGPPPVVDGHLKRDVGFGPRARRRRLLRPGSRAPARPRATPSTYCARTVQASTSAPSIGPQRLDHLQLLVADRRRRRGKGAAPWRPAPAAGAGGSAPCHAGRRPVRSSRRGSRRLRSPPP